MTAPPPPIDPGNSLLAETPAQITTALIPAPSGQRMALTIRTQTTTLTVLLTQADAKTWGEQITTGAAAMSGSGLIVASGHQMPATRDGQ